MNRLAKYLFCVFLLSLAGLAFGQPGPNALVAVPVVPAGTNDTVLTINTPTALPGGAVGVAYSFTFDATGGLTPYFWLVTSGTLPPGLNLTSGGSLTGTPTAAGAFTFSV